MMQSLEYLLEQLRGAWRFRWLGMAVTWALCLAGWAATLTVPNKYAASSTVFVDTQTALGAATRDITVESSVDLQIQRVRQALLGGPQLTKIADETGLTARAVSPQERQGAVELLRRDIQITGGVSRDTAGAGIYVLSYSHPDREMSLRVVDRLVNTFVEEALGGKREGSEQAQKFLVEQIAEVDAQLRQAEDRRADFKKKNVGMMPGAQGDYFTRLQAELEALSKAQTELTVTTRRRDELRRQLRGEQPLVAGGASSGSNVPAGTGGETAIRIRENRQRLEDLLLRFTDKYPDVIALRATIKELEQRQAEEIAAARGGDASAAARIGLNSSPVYQNLQVQFNQAEVDMATLQADIGDRRRRVASLQGLTNTAPEVEAEFARLDRDYGIIKTRYEALVERLGRTRLGEQAAQTGVIDFDVIDPPSAGFNPVSPNRKLLTVLVLFGAIAAGAGAAVLLNLLRPVFSSSRQLNLITGLPVLGVVSMTWLEKHELNVRRSVFVFTVATFGLVAASGVFMLAQPLLVGLVQGWMA